jgi:hypothetical protein
MGSFAFRSIRRAEAVPAPAAMMQKLPWLASSIREARD